MLRSLPPQDPGVYPGGGQAGLLRPNSQQYLFQQQLVTSGQVSIAVQLERIKALFYPSGASFQIWFTDVNGVAANPGTIDVEVQASDIDVDGQYSNSVGLTSVTSPNYSGRVELPWLWAKFVRVKAVTITNAVYLNVLVTR